MMSVKILEFGSNWWVRFGREHDDPYRYTCHAAYYNSAGIRCANKVRRYWVLPGLVRFNGVGDFNPHFPYRSIGETFWCANPVFTCGGNRVLFVRRAAKNTVPDHHLVAVSSDRHGALDFRNPGWRSQSIWPISISQLRDRQEALLLMGPEAWLRSALGLWRLVVRPSLQNGASLQLAEEVAQN
ncbi:MAG: hypothetical protein ABSA54_00090 [Terriglobales bacterium]|jgi:hypothetical protein